VNEFLQKVWDQAKEPVEILGYVGQLVFFTRFVVQWIASERRKESVIPEAFWWISIVGGAITLGYALVHDPPLPAIIIAQLSANVIYVRNLVLVRRMKHRLAAGSAAPDA
jgi:lipid-A-disaccharide synthase-like uncharacterized protein